MLLIGTIEVLVKDGEEIEYVRDFLAANARIEFDDDGDEIPVHAVNIDWEKLRPAVE